MDYKIREMKKEDWIQVKEIYRQGIETNFATFEKDVPTWESWDDNHIKECRYVLYSKNEILGWVSLSKVSHRQAYRGVAEVSIYINENFKGKGLGGVLLQKVIVESFNIGYWTLQSTIIRDNEASIHLHRKHGFREVGYREKIGIINGEYKDTVLMEIRKRDE